MTHFVFDFFYESLIIDFYLFLFTPYTFLQGGIAWRLSYPSDTMIDAYGFIAIGSIRIASFCFLGIVGCCMIPQIVICLSREFCTINVVEIEL